MRALIIDNYDSFTYNFYQLLSELGAHCMVYRNDAIDVAGIEALRPSHILLSPGPGTPERPSDFGVCQGVINELAKKIPTLGVCFGHQGIIHYLGGKVMRAAQAIHGKVSAVRHFGDSPLFKGIEADFPAMRYHSLIGDRSTIPASLRVTAETREDGLVMAVQHNSWPLFGVQFHPESIGTRDGKTMLKNFMEVMS